MDIIFDATPTAPPPQGATSNFVDPPSIAYRLRLTVYVLLPIMAVFWSFRLYTAARIRASWGADDYLCAIAGVIVSAFCGLELALSDDTTPLGKESYNVSVSQTINARYIGLTLASMIMFSLGALFVKSTLLILYLRLFHPVRVARVSIWVMLVAMALAHVIFIIYSLVLLASPPDDLTDRIAYLWLIGNDSRRLSFGIGVFGTITDLITLVIPIAFIQPLNIPRPKKIGIMVIFLTGLAACACSLAGAVSRGLQLGTSNETHEGVLTQILGVAELTVGHTCSCLPVLAVLFKRIATSPRFGSLARYLRIQPSDGSLPSGDPALLEKNPKKGLPTIPRAYITGIRSFIHKLYQSNNQAGNSETIETFTVDALDNVDIEYHAHLKTAQACRNT
ncbi:hypothetical protein B0I35DRAFT_484647 [Stachybotrys elegans]|uniref:Rhodopsin domain-containing protein n=1 Tax=Stachybotrys elegans TaxID=80388 RepID=A0A8K0SED2_9HYPO|nr:hypothetical protein B0I35DRAFT_484647 [Stachybotrys elegans]